MKRVCSIFIVTLVALSMSLPAMAKGPKGPKGGGPKGNNGNHYGWYKNGGPKGYPIYNQWSRLLGYQNYYDGYAPYGDGPDGYYVPSYGTYYYGPSDYFDPGF